MTPHETQKDSIWNPCRRTLVPPTATSAAGPAAATTETSPNYDVAIMDSPPLGPAEVDKVSEVLEMDADRAANYVDDAPVTVLFSAKQAKARAVKGHLERLGLTVHIAPTRIPAFAA